MELFTRVELPETGLKIDYTKKLAFFGSCFADNMSAQFANRGFCTLANPFGTVYNPLSLAAQIRDIVEGKVFGKDDAFQDTRNDNGHGDGLWHCWDAHSSLSGHTREECIDKLNAATTQAREFLQKANAVFVTLGTAFVYFLNASGSTAGGRVVANCHRQDPKLFTRRMVSVEEATEALAHIVSDLHRLSPAAKIVFTVSPLRHMADGAHQNSLSKATLMLAVEKVMKRWTEIATSPSAPRNDKASRASASVYTRICEAQQSCALRNDIAEYFPSYEIVMDELRDYRFYADDMIHLSKTAEQIIFERMVETYCSDATRADIARVEKFVKMAGHRIVNPDSPATAEFVKKVRREASELEKEISGLKLEHLL